MEKEFAPYELAVKLKELGFDEPCFGWYSNMEGNVLRHGYCKTYLGIENCAKAPLYQQAFRWFREKHDVVGIVKFGTNDFTFNIFNSDGIGLLTKESLAFNGAYEEAELACLTKLIEIVEQIKN